MMISRIASVTLIGLLCGILTTASQAQPLASTIDLTVLPIQSQFSVGEPVRLILVLKNNSTDTAALQTTVPGSFRIVSVMRDGQIVNGRTTPIFYAIPLISQFAAGLVLVKRNVGLQVSYTSQRDFALHTVPESLYSVDYNSGAPEITFYALSQPGTYIVTFQYKYPGPDAPFVSREESLPGIVIFSVVP